MFGRTHSFGTDEIPVTVCHTADDVRRAAPRRAPKMPVVRIEPVQEVFPQPTPQSIRVANPTIRDVLKDVMDRHGVTYSELVGKRRRYLFCVARQEAMYRLRVALQLSLPHLGRIFHRDYTTTGYSIAAHADRHNLPMPEGLGGNWKVGLRRRRRS